MRVPVTSVIVSRLPFLTVREAALVGPALDMDIYLVRVHVGFIYEPLTAVRTEKPLV